MKKMHLRAAGPANDGAHRLAWWIGTQPDAQAAFEIVGASLGDIGAVDRMLSGELTPGMAWGLALRDATDGAVLPHDWYHDATCGWFDAPAAVRDALTPIAKAA